MIKPVCAECVIKVDLCLLLCMWKKNENLKHGIAAD